MNKINRYNNIQLMFENDTDLYTANGNVSRKCILEFIAIIRIISNFEINKLIGFITDVNNTIIPKNIISDNKKNTIRFVIKNRLGNWWKYNKVSGNVKSWAEIESALIFQSLFTIKFFGFQIDAIGFCNNIIPVTAIYDNWNPTSIRRLGL